MRTIETKAHQFNELPEDAQDRAIRSIADLIDPDKLYYHYTGSYCLELPIPGQCVIDCSHQGECYHDCDYWIDNLGWDLDMRKVHLELLAYGAWDQDELNEKGDREVLIILLWIACCDIKEEAHYHAQYGEDN